VRLFRKFNNNPALVSHSRIRIRNAAFYIEKEIKAELT
jgi:hypothetical protein